MKLNGRGPDHFGKMDGPEQQSVRTDLRTDFRIFGCKMSQKLKAIDSFRL